MALGVYCPEEKLSCAAAGFAFGFGFGLLELEAELLKWLGLLVCAGKAA